MCKSRVSFFFLPLLLLFASCATSKDAHRRITKQLQQGKITEDTSYVYSLPYKDKAHIIVQGYFSLFSHKNRAALDFKMKKGTAIYAARDGVVVRLKKDSNRGGWSKKNRPFGNYIIIQHSDGSRAGYWHLQYNSVLPNVGDTVQQEQLIAKSGRTGYAMFPHLHFLVWRSNNGNWQPIGTRFRTSKGTGYLRPLHFYKAAGQE
jgi:murein DD-endopeptidase MepM/ murein hydrolase activator NlpD